MAEQVTPAWSRALAQVQSSPYWGDWNDAANVVRRDMFIDEALEYPSFAALPGDLKAIFEAANARLRRPVDMTNE